MDVVSPRKLAVQVKAEILDRSLTSNIEGSAWNNISDIFEKKYLITFMNFSGFYDCFYRQDIVNQETAISIDSDVINYR